MYQKLSNDLLKAMCRYYTKEHGGLVSELKSWNFNFAETSTIPELKKVVEKYISDENIVQKLFNELVSRP